MTTSSRSDGALSDGTYPTTCWECSVNCGALATVRDGKVVEMGPDRNNPYSKGNFCLKGIRGAPGLMYHPDRVLHPMRRTGPRGSGRWQRITWDEALDEMADRLAEVRRAHGPEAIVGATSGANFSRSLITALMVRSIGSPNWMINQDLCGGCRAVSARAMGLDIDNGGDVEHARTALIVGRNPSVADPVQWAEIKAARRRGLRLVVIDPKRTPVADSADLWLRPRIGTDAALALAMIAVTIREDLYDKAFVARWCTGLPELATRAGEYPPELAETITGVPAGDIVQAARLYADGPSTFLSGHGIDAFAGGTDAFRAFHALVAISGNVDRRGGNLRNKKPKGFSNYVELLHRPAHRLPLEVERRTIGADRYPLWAGPEGWQTACHNPSVIDAMLTGTPYPVRAAYISGVNILLTYPDARRTIEAIKSLDFVAVATHLMTPTAELADIVLPKTTSLEEEEVSFQAIGQIVTLARAVAPPQGEARQEIDIAVPLLDRLEARQAVARRLIPWRSQREFNESLLGSSGITFDELEAKGYARPAFEIGDFEARPFPTPSGKIELAASRVARVGLDPLPAYVPRISSLGEGGEHPAFPLTLITGDREKAFHHTRFREQAWARKVSPDPRLLVHPATAASLGVTDGDWVLVETQARVGTCRLKVKVSDQTPPEVVSTGMGWWRPEDTTPDRGVLDININAALAYAGPFDPLTGSASIRGQRCRVVRLSGGEHARMGAAAGE
ncbi:MAG: molybdopterin-dependent oxidoreductase [Hyphomicrobiaceae bacterium]|nr:molybdopterin-dependent oxidoreductase [Hyphomicrobiaceae bacterium]